MHRLLQGEVGSGKTVVALTALLMAVQGGYQGALMAPTEVLAEQHSSASATARGPRPCAREARRCSASGRCGSRCSRTAPGAAERRRLAAGSTRGEVDIVVGTHALIYGERRLPRLGVAVIDEQHRFGVEQRALLATRAHEAPTPTCS